MSKVFQAAIALLSDLESGEESVDVATSRLNKAGFVIDENGTRTLLAYIHPTTKSDSKKRKKAQKQAAPTSELA